MNFKEIWCDNVEWIRLAKDMVQWRTPVNTEMKGLTH
jgi:hypothetical protein